MNTQNIRKAILIFASLALPLLSGAANVTLKTSDGGGTSSLTGSTNWSDNAAPSAANDYFTSTFFLRTPTNAGNVTFAGHSLTLQTPSGQSAPMRSIIFKGPAGVTITINNLTNAGGIINSGSGNIAAPTFTGNAMYVVANSTIQADQGPFIIAYPIFGSANLTNTGSGGGNINKTVTYTGNNSGFTGRLLASGAFPTVIAFGAMNSVPGNPATFTPNQIDLGAGCALQDNVGISLTNSNGGITLEGNATITCSTSNGAVTLISVPITDNGLSYNLTKRGGGILTLAGNNTFAGGLSLTAFTAGSQLNINHASALGTGTFTLASGAVAAALLDNTSGTPITLATDIPQTWNNNLTFIGSSSLNMGAGSVTMGANITATVSNNTLTVGSLSDSGVGRSLVKQGPGTLVISNGAYYSGSTTISNGVLAFTGSGSLSTTNIHLASATSTLDVSAFGGLVMNANQILSGYGTISGSVTDAPSVTILPGKNNIAGTLTINGNLSLNGGTTLNYDLSTDTTAGNGINDLIIVNGNLDLAGATTINLIGIPSVGTYTLFKYNTFSGNLANLSVPVGFSLNNNSTTKTIELIVTHVPAALTWRGDEFVNAWDLATTADWIQSGTNQFFYTGDTVTFDDSGSNGLPVTLTGSIAPAATIVNATKDYDFAGTGILSGSLTKSGAGTLILENNNTYTGPTTINGGTLQIGNPNGTSGGTSGTIGSGALVNNASLVVNRSDAFAYSGSITGSGNITNLSSGNVTLAGSIAANSVTMAGSGALFLGASNTYTGPTVITGGSVHPQNADALGATSSGTFATNGGQLYIDANINLLSEPLTLGGNALRKGGGGVTTLGGPITLVADTTIQLDGGATLNLTNANGIPGNGFNLTLAGDSGSQGNISNKIALGSGSLTVSGSGTWTVAQTNTYTGKTFLNGGTLSISAETALGNQPSTWTADYIAFGGGTLGITTNSGVTNFAFADAKRGITFNGNGGFNIGPGATLTISNELAGFGNLTKGGAGTLLLIGTNSLSGVLYLDRFLDGNNNDGITRITTTNAVMNFTEMHMRNTSVNTAGGATLQLDGSKESLVLPQPLWFSCRQASAANATVENLAGTNSLTGAITITSGGSFVNWQADANTRLNINGDIQYNDTLLAARTMLFTGPGTTVVNGAILLSANATTPLGVTKIGTDTLVLAGANTYSDITTVSNGLLLLTGSISSTGAVTVAGGTLAGTGTINTALNIQPAGTLAPGASVGTFTVNGDFNLAGNLAIEVNKSLAQSNDFVTVSGALANTGTGLVTVSNLGPALVAGDTFKLFNQPVAGGQALNVVGSGVQWTNKLAIDGSIAVLSTVSLVPTNISVSVAGNTLTLSWPTDHLSWVLQTQTNSITTGLGTNWVDVPNSGASTQAVITINPTNPTVFFRLRSP